MKSTAVGLAALLLAGFANAQTVIATEGDPDQNTIWYADTDNAAATQVAAEFTVDGTATVNQVSYWGGYTQTTTASSTDSYTLDIYKAGASGVGSLVAAVSLGNANETATGKLIQSTPEYAYNASFAGIVLGPGSYFLGVQRNGGSTNGIWGWESAPGAAGDILASENSAGLWSTTSGDAVAYTLYGTLSAVPEPVAPLLLMAGLPVVGLFIRRQRRA
jgi:hypothetical protein